jgi:hypothetical protein
MSSCTLDHLQPPTQTQASSITEHMCTLLRRFSGEKIYATPKPVVPGGRSTRLTSRPDDDERAGRSRRSRGTPRWKKQATRKRNVACKRRDDDGADRRQPDKRRRRPRQASSLALIDEGDSVVRVSSLYGERRDQPRVSLTHPLIDRCIEKEEPCHRPG